MPDVRSEKILGPYQLRGRWYLLHQFPDPDARSGCTRQTLWFATESDAEKEKARLSGHIASITHTVETAMIAFREAKRAARVARNTLIGYEAAIMRWWPDADRVVLAGLNARKERERYDQLVRQYAAATHHGTLKQCRTFLRWCRRQGWIQQNPLADIESVGRKNRGKPTLYRDEARKLYEHCIAAAPRDDGALAVLLALVMQMRAHEIVALRVRDVDAGGAILRVSTSKTERGRRPLEIPPPLQAILRARAGVLLDGEQGPTRPPLGPLFGYHTRNWPRQATRRICRRLELPPTCAQGLRATAATLARSAGMASAVIAESLGHTSAAVTEGHYIDPAQREAQERRESFRVLAGGREA